MVNYSTSSLDTTFAALSDPTRRAILARLAGGESTVTELAKPFKVSLPAISKHLRVLEKAGLLSRERDGRIHRCSLNAKRLDALAEYLEKTQKEEDPSWSKDKPPSKPPSPSNGRSRPRGRGSSGRGRNPKK
jgi:DNA-binding transcriptional ArsR family regulator